MKPEYEQIYENYASYHLTNKVDEATLEARGYFLKKVIHKFFPKNNEARILDLGCGYGALAYFAMKEGYQNYLGIDVSNEQIVLARNLGIENVVQSNLIEFLEQQKEKTYDFIITFDVLEHLSKAEIHYVSKLVYSLLKNEGEWLIHVPNGVSPFFGAVRYGDFTHEIAFTENSIETILKSVGFREISCHEDTPCVHGLRSLIRWLSWMLFRTMLRACYLAETGKRNAIFSQNLLAISKK